jgi:hypothetical protein
VLSRADREALRGDAMLKRGTAEYGEESSQVE